MPNTTIPVPADTKERFEIVAACPECGGANAWRLLQVLRRCGYCGSALWWPREPGRPGFLVAEDATSSPEAVLDVLQTLDALRERSRRASMLPDRGGPNGDIDIDRSEDSSLPGLNEIKAERRHLFGLDADLKVLAPYVLVSVTLAFHALGRSRGGDRKEFRNLFFVAEDLAPAYPAPWDFRDRGLWVARQRLRPFAAEDLAVRPIPMRDVAVDLERVTRRWRGQRLLIEPDLDPIVFESNLAATNRWWVYRPFHYVRARTPMRDGWFLVDGQFANVAGYPEADEVRRASARDWKPLDNREVRAASPRAIGFRCPECGEDVALVERGELQICSNCGRLLEPTPAGLTTRPYAIVDRESLPWWRDRGRCDIAWLPFFKVVMSAARSETRTPDFAAWLRDAMPLAGPTARLLPADWPESWIPAFDVLTVGRYDAWAFEWAEALTRIRPECGERRFFVEETVPKTNRVLSPAVRWETVRPLLPRLLPELLPKPIQARLNPMILKKLAVATFDVTKVVLVFVPAPVTTEGERRVLGPSSSVGWIPLRDGRWPPDLERDVRRAMERGKRMEAPRNGGGVFHPWIERRSSS